MIRVLLLCAGLLSATAVGCGKATDSDEEFKSNMEKAVEAAEKGKEIVKSPVKPKRSR